MLPYPFGNKGIVGIVTSKCRRAFMKKLVLTLSVYDDETDEKLEELYDAFMYLSEENPGKNLIALNMLVTRFQIISNLKEGQ